MEGGRSSVTRLPLEDILPYLSVTNDGPLITVLSEPLLK